jgi:mannosyltransferase OCH1-like enzyme
MAAKSIPKIIHYVWVGPRAFPEYAKQNLAGWQRNMPGFQFKLWNEENSPMQHHYVQAMYKKRKWAFVSDYIRLYAIESEGGIYLDSDMEVVRSLEPFLNDSCFVGRSKSGHIESAIIGATPHHPFIKKVLEFYNSDTTYSIKNTSPRIIEKTLHKHPFQNVTRYESSHFFPCDAGEECTEVLRENAYTIHGWAETWVPFASLRKFLRRLGIVKFLRSLKTPTL